MARPAPDGLTLQVRARPPPAVAARRSGTSYGAAIKVSPDGQYLYGSNRAVEPAASSVVVCRIHQGSCRPARPCALVWGGLRDA
eukprot:SAG11_NODE_5192_length_1634_cov_1.570033_2_plen_84_part_00